ncbi:MAG: 3-dehydroquinate synthase, partial [Flavobacteriales bacterium]
NNLKAVSSFEKIDPLVYESISIKNEVVLEDPTEKGLRKILNFGHTLGHAIESYYLESDDDKMLLHGEAIAAGMVLEAWLSHQLHGLPSKDLEDIKNTFLQRYPKILFSKQDIEQIIDLLKFDKKNAYGQINFVLLRAIGDPVLDVQIKGNLLQRAFAYYSE